MSGEKNLNALIKNVKPTLNVGKYVFVSIDSLRGISTEDIVCTFTEEEGLSLVLEKSKADELNLSYSFMAAWITLKVHSSLEAVGLTAKVASALAQAGISCNAIAAYYHDHVFVPYHDADKAMATLRKLEQNIPK